ncbi:hypothetical protein [Maribacter sp. IgM3_T14_3]|uniref:hypothetical protein n=1 Tax=Maribacter sp. IgM3_T14_3 TaxID=3415140 RepID=UPI003C70071E
MQLNIHSEGIEDHLITLQEKYLNLKTAVLKNLKLNPEEKKGQLKKIKTEYLVEKKNVNGNFY